MSQSIVSYIHKSLSDKKIITLSNLALKIFGAMSQSDTWQTETELLLTTLDNFDIICIEQFHEESINDKVNRRYLWLIQWESLKSIIGEQEYIWSLRDEV